MLFQLNPSSSMIINRARLTSAAGETRDRVNDTNARRSSLVRLKTDCMLHIVLLKSMLHNTRNLLAKCGRIEAIVSLPDHAFRKSGAQNKTSILFFRKFAAQEKLAFDRAFGAAIARAVEVGEAIAVATVQAELNYSVFLAEANQVGYTPTGNPCDQTDPYRSAPGGQLG